MKYCPYCGTSLADSTASFCSECGKTIPKEKGKTKKCRRKQKEKQSTEESKTKQIMDEGYDGYYDDVLPSDLGLVKEGVDKTLVKKILLLVLGVLLVLILCIMALYLL